MDYTDKCKEVFRMIDALVEREEFDKKQICFLVLKNTGFSEKFSKKYIDSSIENGMFFEHKNKVISNNPEKK